MLEGHFTLLQLDGGIMMFKLLSKFDFKRKIKGIPFGELAYRIGFYGIFIFITACHSGYYTTISKQGKSYDRTQSYEIIGNRICKQGKSYQRENCYEVR
jgi:hypothetical protein